jgi:hypothetical protein
MSKHCVIVEAAILDLTLPFVLTPRCQRRLRLGPTAMPQSLYGKWLMRHTRYACMSVHYYNSIRACL